MKRKFTAMILAVVMIASMFSFGSLTASADDAYKAVTGIKLDALVDVTLETGKTFTAIDLSKATAEPADADAVKAKTAITWTMKKKDIATATNITAFNPETKDTLYGNDGYGVYTITATIEKGKTKDTAYTQTWTINVTEKIDAKLLADKSNDTVKVDVSVLNAQITASTTSIPYYIDLINEKLDGTAFAGTNKFTIKSYSLDGGTKWKVYKPKDKFLDKGGITKLLNKGVKLVIADQDYDKKAKAPKPGGRIVSFSAIEKREKATKLVVNYAIGGPDSTIHNKWVLTTKGGATAADTQEVEISGIPGNKKVPVDTVMFKGIGPGKKDRAWQKFDDLATPANASETSLTTVKALNSNINSGKPFKTPYAVRYGSYAKDSKYYPATKEFKISVSSELKVPKASFKEDKDSDPKTFTVKYKDNMRISKTSGDILNNTWSTPSTDPESSGTKIYVRTLPTAKKPVSAVQELDVK